MGSPPIEVEPFLVQVPPVDRHPASSDYFQVIQKVYNSPPLPVNSLVEHSLFSHLLPPSTLEPALMSRDSLFNGVLKFDHPQAAMSLDDYAFCLQSLEDTFGLIISSDVVPLDQIADLVVSDSASGFPYSSTVGSTKGQVLSKLTTQELYRDFKCFTQVISSTLKVELRKPGKEARLFRPAPVSSIVAGLHLFYYQNESLLAKWNITPLCLGFSSPGTDLSAIWSKLFHFGGQYLSIDGAQWDAHFPLALAQVIRDFRIRHLPPSEAPAVIRYYNQMYNGYTIVEGTPFQLAGNPSGHYNTAVDNSLAEFLMVQLILRKLEVHPSKVLFYVCGDDLVVATRDERLTPVAMSNVALDYGVFYEFLDGDEFSHFFNLVFVGTHPLITADGLRYSYDATKQLSSLHYTSSKLSMLDLFSKCVSIGSNLFYEREAFEKAKSCAAFLLECSLVEMCPTVASLWRSVSSAVLSSVYNCFERNRLFSFSL